MKNPLSSHVHLAGAHASARDLEPSTVNLAEVTCEACREHVRTMNAVLTRARRNGSVRWLAPSARPADESARHRAFHVLEELGDDGSFRRFDLRKWLSSTPGEHGVTLRVRRGEER